MGLKGKIEAIIYAAEEPVTLDQIALLVKEPVMHELAEEKARAETAEAEAAAQAAAEQASAQQSQETAETVAPQTQGTAEESAEQAVCTAEPENAEAEDPAALDTELAAPNSRQEAAADPEFAPQNDPAAGTDGAQTDSSVAEAASPEPASGSEAAASPTEASETAKPNVASKRKARAEIAPEVRARVRVLIEELTNDYATMDRGMEIRQVAGGFRMATKPEHHDVVKLFAKSLKPPLRLSLPALETLAVVAYKQPVTAPEVGEIRGVDAQGVIATLLDRKLVTTAGRKAVIGRPILYKTTKEFLMRFGLKDISELPSMEEFEKLAQDAGQVDMFQVDEEGSAELAQPEGEVAETTEQDFSDVDSPDREQEDPARSSSSGAEQASDDVAETPSGTGEPVH